MSPLAFPADASVATYWDVDGVPLSTYAYAITSSGATRATPPPMRGDNRKVPHQPGQIFLPKIPDSRVITLEMWVIGVSPDGTVRNEARFDYNWRQLVKLLWRPETELALTKRFRNGTDDTLTTATAKAQFQSGLNPTMTGRRRADFSVDLFLSDPFFYGAAVATPINKGANVNINVLGDYSTRAITLHCDGPLTSPIWTYTSAGPGVWFRYNAAIADGDALDVDVAAFSAMANVSGTPRPSSGYAQHSGGYFWLQLQPGTATISLNSSAGSGPTTLIHNPVFW